MNAFFAGLIALSIPRQRRAPSSTRFDVADQPAALSGITNKTPNPLAKAISQLGTTAPRSVSLQVNVAARCEALAPQLRGTSYLAVEELVAVVDTNSRKMSP
jgi:hypothetical protein